MLVEIQFFHDKASQTFKYHLISQSFRRIVWIQNFFRAIQPKSGA